MEVAPLAPRMSAEQIERWLRERIAFYTELPLEEVTPDLSLADAGFDSVYAFALSGDIEAVLGVEIEPTLLWDLDTVAELAAHLSTVTAAASASN